MLCYAMLCYAMLCYAMLCYAMLCYAILLFIEAISLYTHYFVMLQTLKLNNQKIENEEKQRLGGLSSGHISTLFYLQCFFACQNYNCDEVFKLVFFFSNIISKVVNFASTVNQDNRKPNSLCCVICSCKRTPTRTKHFYLLFSYLLKDFLLF
jgi:hypothetical protein